MVNNFHYQVPNDAALMLYDFYFLTGVAYPVDLSTDVKCALDKSAEDLVDALHREITMALRFSISSELRHLFDGKVDWKDAESTAARDRNEDFIREYYRQYRLSDAVKDGIDIDWYVKAKSYEDIKPFYHSLQGNSESRIESFVAIQKVQKILDLSDTALSEIFIDLFSNLVWNSSYGGSTWAEIAIGYQKMLTADTLTEKVIWIDHAYDLHHNTDTVFNKVAFFSKNGSYGWLIDALDWKRNVADIRDFSQRVSPSLRRFVARVAKEGYNLTFENYTASNGSSALTLNAGIKHAYDTDSLSENLSSEQQMKVAGSGATHFIINPNIYLPVSADHKVCVTSYFYSNNPSLATIAELLNDLEIEFSLDTPVVFGYQSGKHPYSIKAGKILSHKVGVNLTDYIDILGATKIFQETVALKPVETSLVDDDYMVYESVASSNWKNVMVASSHVTKILSSFKWLQYCKIENCKITLTGDKSGKLVPLVEARQYGEPSVVEGWWKNGILDGCFFNGTWKNGTFKNSIFQSGTWFLGDFLVSSVFKSGKWKKQKYAYQGSYNGVVNSFPPHAELFS